MLLIFSIFIATLNLQVFAETVNSSINLSIEAQSALQSMKIELGKLSKMSSIDQKKYAESSLRKSYNNLSVSSKQKLISLIEQEPSKLLASVQKQYIDPNYKIPTQNSNVVRLAGLFACDTLCQLNNSLLSLQIPLLARYSLLTIGASIEASLTIPASQLIAAVVALGAVAVVAYYWSDLSPQFNKIIDLFKQTFLQIVNSVVALFNILYSSIEAGQAESIAQNATLDKCVAKHMNKQVTDKIRKGSAREIYFGPSTGTVILVYDVPGGTKGNFNLDLGKNPNCLDNFTYQKQNETLPEGYVLIICLNLNRGVIFHSHMRHKRFAEIDIRKNRYDSGSKATIRLKPLPVTYEEKYANKPSMLEELEFNKLINDMLLK